MPVEGVLTEWLVGGEVVLGDLPESPETMDTTLEWGRQGPSVLLLSLPSGSSVDISQSEQMEEGIALAIPP